MPKDPLKKVYHVLNIPEKEQAFIREIVEDLTDTYIKGKAVSAAGEAAEGILSNPSLAYLVGGGILAAVAAYVGKDKLDAIMEYFGDAGTALSPDADIDDKRDAVNSMTRALKDLLPFGFLFPEPPPPPPPGEQVPPPPEGGE